MSLNNLTQSKELQIALAAAKRGATIALKYYANQENLHITFKEDESVLTIADGETQKVIQQYISSEFSDATFIAEESENTEVPNQNLWIIDPIDGTREYAHGIDLWSILIAYATDNEIKVGVCYFPALDLLLYAEKGKGAYLNDVQVSVSKNSDFAKAFFSYSPITYFTEEEKIVLDSIIGTSGSSRSFASSYSAHSVAISKMDFFIANSHNKIWDIAPFIRIIEEAGGTVTDWNGDSIKIANKPTPVLASNGLLHNELLQIVKNK